ncbi:MAG: ABC transporter permease [Alkalibacterium sp.]|uniref:ABC transporter permease n=1 Tax=Alkalibacterium sp. TaxID=1872447 RepID=UPI00264799E9|nr:ABC transporter permease subunit [Alkalibacterium sp.]MDN6294538.1 ABC transporter permease [Alkalibacterium sp.]MDN6296053.1 ABC transporter permease [Alkalibacterium sp.]
MFSKPIFKQSVKTNWRLWAIITIVASIILSGFIIGYDAAGYASIASAAEGTAFSSLLSSMDSLLGNLENFYKLIALILGIVYVVFTANNLVVNEVDSGSMAYTLSTPIKRRSVIFTKSLYMISSVLLMYVIVSLAGLGASQLQYNNVTGYPITDDVEAAAEALDQSKRYLSERLYLIEDNEQAMRDAAAARDMDLEAYSIYLTEVINDHSYEETAKIITDEREDIYEEDDDIEDEDIKITTEDLMKDPQMILESNDALTAGAKVKGISVNEYQQFVNNEVKSLRSKENKKVEESEEGQEDTQPAFRVTEENAGLLLQTVIESSANALNMNSNQVEDNLTLTKDPAALEAAIEATGLQEEQIITMTHNTMVSSARAVDQALEFDRETYFWLSIGLFSLILAISSISFFTSTLFNRTGVALAGGGGIPFAFFLLTMVQQLMDDTPAILEYLTLTTLFDTDAILASGEFGWGLIALGIIAFGLYTAANIIFTKKDLPL